MLLSFFFFVLLNFWNRKFGGRSIFGKQLYEISKQVMIRRNLMIYKLKQPLTPLKTHQYLDIYPSMLGRILVLRMM